MAFYSPQASLLGLKESFLVHIGPETKEKAEIQSQKNPELDEYLKIHSSMQAVTARIEERAKHFNGLTKPRKIKILERKRERLVKKGKPIPKHLYPKLLDIAYTPEGQIDIQTTKDRIQELHTVYPEGRVVNDLTKLQAKTLNALVEMLHKLQELREDEAALAQRQKETSETIDQENDEKLLNELYEDFQDTMDEVAKKDAWEEKPAYEEMQEDFDFALKNPVFKDRTGTFEAFYNDGLEFSSYTQSDMELWYFAYLGSQTNDFEEPFVFGDKEKFGNNHAENVANNPRAYALWLEMNNINTQTLKERQRLVDEKAFKINELVLSGQLATLSQLIEDNEKTLEHYYQLDKENDDYLPKFDDLDKNAPNYYHVKERWIDSVIQKLEPVANQLNGGHDKKVMQEVIRQLAQHKELAQLQDHKYNALNKVEVIDGKEVVTQLRFTRSELNNERYRQQMQELSMEEFAAAAHRIDKPFSQSHWDHLNPRVRGILIASVCKQGFKYDTLNELGELEETGPHDGIAWMITQVTKSPYLNATVHGQKLNRQQHEALAYALAGSHVINDLEENESMLRFFTLLNRLKKSKGNDEEALNEIVNHYSEALIEENAGLNPEAIAQKQKDYKEKVKISYEFKALAEKAIFDIDSQEAGDLKEKIEDGTFKSILSAQEFGQMLYFQRKVETNREILGRRVESRSDLLEGFKINVQGFAKAFEIAKQKNKGLNIDDIDDAILSSDPAEFEKYYNVFATGLPYSQANGEHRFLAGLRVVNRNIREGKNIKEFTLQEAMVIETLEMLQEELRYYQKVQGMANQKEAEIRDALSGETYLDKASYLASEVWYGLKNFQGDPAFAVVCGLGVGAAVFAGYQARDYFKDKGLFSWGGAALLLGVGSAISKEVTGVGLGDITGLNTLDQKMEGTHESVLLEKGRENVEDERVYARAIRQLNNGSVEQWLNWYESSDINGQGRDDLMPYGVDLDKINPTALGYKENRKMKAQRALREGIEQMALYVSAKRNGEPGNIQEGLQILNELYVKSVKNLEYEPTKAESTLPPILRTHFHHKPHGVPWEEMIEVEIDAFDVMETIGKNGLTQELDWLEKSGQGFMNWSREQVGEIEGLIKDNLPEWEDKAHDLAQFLGKVGENQGKKLLIKGREIKFWLKGEAYTIVRNSITKDVQLVKEGIKTIGGGAVMLHDFAADELTKGLRGIQTIAETDKPTFLTGYEFTEADVLGSNPQNLPVDKLLNTPDISKNPAFEHFGFYQKAFYEAAKSENYFFTTPVAYESSEPFYDEQVGYYFSQVSLAEVGLTSEAGANEKFQKMHAESWRRAEETYMAKGLTQQQIDKYMSPIHRIMGTRPEKMVVAWRCPLPGSKELWNKENGYFTGSFDAAQHKHKLPFRPDPRQDLLEQVAAFSGYTVGQTGVMLARKGTNVLSYGVTIPFSTLEILGQGGMAALNFAFNDPALSEFIGDLTQRSGQFKTNVAEFTTQLDYAPFYKNSKENRDIYKLCLEHASSPGHMHRLFLGIFEGSRDYEGTRYLNKPVNFTYESLHEMYLDWVKEGKMEKNYKFEALIKPKLAQEKGEPYETDFTEEQYFQ